MAEAHLPAPWTPDQPLRADATDRQIQERARHLWATGSDLYWPANLAREYAEARVAVEASKVADAVVATIQRNHESALAEARAENERLRGGIARAADMLREYAEHCYGPPYIYAHSEQSHARALREAEEIAALAAAPEVPRGE